MRSCLLLLLGATEAICALQGRPIAASRPSRVSRVVATFEWEDCEGCQLLRPKGEARALVHFLGGVFVSPAPQVAYRSMLESLSNHGYMVLATPFSVDFDYCKTADEVYGRYSAAKATLERQYGAMPQVALGHSLGALMQVLLGCMHSEYTDACDGAALISYNNKPVSDAIPAFEELFVPALAPLEPLVQKSQVDAAISAVGELREGGLQLARQLNELAFSPWIQLGNTAGVDAPSTAASAFDRALCDAEALAALADQVPDVLGAISRGTSEFTPSPDEVRTLISRQYSQRAPLIVSFSDDTLDESPTLEAALPAAIGARSVRLRGTHLTPLAVDPDSPTNPLLPIPEPLRPQLRPALLADLQTLIGELDEYFGAAVAQRSRDEPPATAQAVEPPPAETATTGVVVPSQESEDTSPEKQAAEVGGAAQLQVEDEAVMGEQGAELPSLPEEDARPELDEAAETASEAATGMAEE